MTLYQKYLQTITHDLAQARVRLSDAKELSNNSNLTEEEFIKIKSQFIEDAKNEVEEFMKELQSMKDV